MRKTIDYRLSVFAILFVAFTLFGPAGSKAADGAKFVLVHGAWHVGSAWNDVISNLRGLGHDGEAITMAGHGVNTDRKAATFNDSEKILLEVLNRQTRPVIVVGHSAGGVLLQQTVGKAADKLAAVVFHNAFIIPHMTSMYDALPPKFKEMFSSLAEASEDYSLPVNEGFWRNVLLAGVPEKRATEIIGMMVPQPFNFYRHKIDASSFADIKAPKFALLATGDKSIAWYRSMAQRLGQSTVVEISGGHEVLLTNPAELARGLAEIARLITKK